MAIKPMSVEEIASDRLKRLLHLEQFLAYMKNLPPCPNPSFNEGYITAIETIQLALRGGDIPTERKQT